MSERESLRVAYGKTLVEIGKEDKDVVALDCDLAGSTKSAFFEEEFPDRHFNMGISEMDMIGTAAGLATAGKLPFASSFAIFAAGRAWEAVRQSVALTKLNVNIVASHGGITVGEDGKSHQCLEDFSLTTVLPNFTVICPADSAESKKATRAIYRHRGPVYMRTSRYNFPVYFDEDYEFEIGKSHTVKEGSDLTFIGCGLLFHFCLDAARKLEKDGISALKPLDKNAIIKAAKETGAIVTAEEHLLRGGLGCAVNSLTSKTVPVPVEAVGVDDKFARSGDPESLLERYNLDTGSILDAARIVLDRKG